jgi:hypothetical protein
MITTAAVALVASAIVFILVVQLSSSPEAKDKLADPTFELGSAADRAENVRETGPLLFQAPQGGGTRDIYVQHLGGKTTENWVAFLAYRNGRRDCHLEWNQRTERFTEPCTRRTYPPDPGPDFEHFRAVARDDGTLVVDFRPATTTTIAG